jgi:hypothetical protein
MGSLYLRRWCYPMRRCAAMSPEMVLSLPVLYRMLLGRRLVASSCCRISWGTCVCEEGWFPGPRSSSQLKNLGCPQPVVAAGKIKL